VKTGMLSQPALNCRGFVDATVVGHHIDPVKAPGWIDPVEEVQYQVAIKR
jgi:hypothetical protein